MNSKANTAPATVNMPVIEGYKSDTSLKTLYSRCRGGQHRWKFCVLRGYCLIVSRIIPASPPSSLLD